MKREVSYELMRDDELIIKMKEIEQQKETEENKRILSDINKELEKRSEYYL